MLNKISTKSKLKILCIITLVQFLVPSFFITKGFFDLFIFFSWTTIAELSIMIIPLFVLPVVLATSFGFGTLVSKDPKTIFRFLPLLSICLTVIFLIFFLIVLSKVLPAEAGYIFFILIPGAFIFNLISGRVIAKILYSKYAQ